MRTGIPARASMAMVVGLAMTANPVLAQEEGADTHAAEGLTGHWVLNTLLSDDPAEQIPRAAVPPGARNREEERPPSGTAQLRRAAERFSLTQPDSTILLAYPDRDVVIYPDGKKRKDVVSDDLEIEYRSWWDGAALIIERRGDRGLTLTERYTIVESTGRLHILTQVEGDRLPAPIAFVRVYDPASGLTGRSTR